MNSSDNQNTAQSSNPLGGIKFDLDHIKAKALAVLKNPKGVWSEIKGDGESIADVYRRYLIFLAALPPVCNFIGMVIIGQSLPFVGGRFRWPLIQGFSFTVVQYALTLLQAYAVACILEFLAPKFGGRADRTSAFKLVVYSLTPVYLAGVLSLIPDLALIGLLFALYSIYVFLCGVTTMTEVPEGEKIKFVAAAVVANIVVGLLIAVVAGLVIAAPSAPSAMSL